MIISQLSGGIGNQLFQWAFAYSLSYINDCSLIIDESFYKNQTKRQVQLKSIPRLRNLKYININSSYELPITVHTIVEEFGKFIEPKSINIYENIGYYLVGYWQSADYFVSISDVVIQSLLPAGNFKIEMMHKYGVLDKKTVSMHIRRTDYLSSGGFHTVQPLSYYQNALDCIDNYDQLLIFSDDPEWCFSNLKFKNQYVITDKHTDIENIWLMSLCHHNIIANSSFSWWGAYINTIPDHKTIAPKIWYNGYDRDTWKNIYCKSWIVI